MELSHKIITRSEFKTSCFKATAFQFNNANVLVLSSKSTCNIVPDCTKVPSSKIICMFVPKFVHVRKFVSVPMFA